MALGFEDELRELINKYNRESDSNTPDFILAEHLRRCLDIFTIAVNERDCWYRKKSGTTLKGTKNGLSH